MTPHLIRRHIARIEADDLRRYPPRLWPHVHTNTRGLILLAQAHGTMPRAARLDLPLRVRVAS